VIEVDEKLESGQLPEIHQRHFSAALAKAHLGVEMKNGSFSQVPERVAVQVIAVRQISRKVGISPVWSDELYDSAVSRNAMKFAHDRHWFPNVFNHVTADDFIEFIIRKWIGQVVEIVNYVSHAARVEVHSDRAWNFVRPAADIQHARPCGQGELIEHRCVVKRPTVTERWSLQMPAFHTSLTRI